VHDSSQFWGDTTSAEALLQNSIEVAYVIPANAGIQSFHGILGPRLREGDNLGMILQAPPACSNNYSSMLDKSSLPMIIGTWHQVSRPFGRSILSYLDNLPHEGILSG
jgi:hypothetical protein